MRSRRDPDWHVLARVEAARGSLAGCSVPSGAQQILFWKCATARHAGFMRPQTAGPKLAGQKKSVFNLHETQVKSGPQFLKLQKATRRGVPN